MKKSSYTTVDEFIALQSPEKHERLLEIRSLIRSVIPEAEELISYRIPCYKHKGLVVGFGVNKNEYSIYAMITTILKEFSKELKDYRFEKSTLHIRLDQELPVSVMKKIIKKRYEHNEQRAAIKNSDKSGNQ